MINSIILANDFAIQEKMPETDKLISKALKCLEMRLKYSTEKCFTNSRDVCSYLRLQLAEEQEEVFVALFLTNQQQLIAFEKLFHGTIDQATIYPRKIIKRAIHHNAAKIIIAHNHPSGQCKPSNQDKLITQDIKKVLDIMDIRLIDHFIVTHSETFSFVENGLF